MDRFPSPSTTWDACVAKSKRKRRYRNAHVKKPKRRPLRQGEGSVENNWVLLRDQWFKCTGSIQDKRSLVQVERNSVVATGGAAAQSYCIQGAVAILDQQSDDDESLRRPTRELFEGYAPNVPSAKTTQRAVGSRRPEADQIERSTAQIGRVDKPAAFLRGHPLSNLTLRSPVVSGVCGSEGSLEEQYEHAPSATLATAAASSARLGDIGVEGEEPYFHLPSFLRDEYGDMCPDHDPATSDLVIRQPTYCKYVLGL